MPRTKKTFCVLICARVPQVHLRYYRKTLGPNFGTPTILTKE